MPGDIGFPVFCGTFSIREDRFVGLMCASLLAQGRSAETREALKKIGTAITPESNPVIVEFTISPK